MNLFKWFKNDELIITKITLDIPIDNPVKKVKSINHTPPPRFHFKSWREVRSEIEPTLANKQKTVLDNYLKNLKRGKQNECL